MVTPNKLRQKAAQYRAIASRLIEAAKMMEAVAGGNEKAIETSLKKKEQTAKRIPKNPVKKETRKDELVALIKKNGPMTRKQMRATGIPRGTCSVLLLTDTFKKTQSGNWTIAEK